MRDRLSIRALFALFVLASAGCELVAQAQVEGGFERSVAVAGPVQLDIRTRSGRVAVRSGPPGAVRVIAQLRGPDIGDVEDRIRRIEANPPIDQAGGVVRIGYLDSDLARRIGISYEITAPPEVRVQSRTGSGDQLLEDVRGPASVETGSGSIAVRRVQADVRASTGSGDIRGEEIAGNFDGRTGSGSIRVSGIGGAAITRSGSGDIEVSQTGSSNVDVSTGSGSITINGARQGLRARAGSGDVRLEGRPGQRWDVSTGSGSIRARFTPDAALELDARTRSGSIAVQQRVVVTQAERRRMRGAIGGGGPMVELSTGSGDIRIQ